MDIEHVRDYTLSLNGVTEDQPFGDDNITFRVEGKIFLCLWLGTGNYNADNDSLICLQADARTQRGTARTIRKYNARFPLEQETLERRVLRANGTRLCNGDYKGIVWGYCGKMKKKRKKASPPSPPQ